MQKIPLTSIKRWTHMGGYNIPMSVSSYCPHCGDKVVFSLASHFYDTHRKAQNASAACPSCDNSVSFYTMNPWKIDEEEKDPDVVYIYPPIKKYRHVKDYSKYIPENLQKAYESTLDSYNSKNYIATAVSCRRTLEGIFLYLPTEGNKEKVLAKAIEKAKKDVDWAAPLNTLAHMIRHGGNLGAHFNEEKEPNEVVAKSMVELLEYLLEYIYELPKNIDELKSNLDNA